MKKIILGIFMMIFPFLGFAQILTEGFEGATFPPTTPGNWIVLDNGVGTTVSWTEETLLSRVNTGLKAAIIDRENVGAGNTSIDWLISPQITVGANSQLRFFTRQTLTGNNGSTYEIRVSTNATQNNLAAYAPVQNWTETTLNATFNIYEEKIVSLAAYPAGTQLYIAFVKSNTQPAGATTGDRWLIDDVKVVQQCLDPTILTVGAITPTTASLGWTNNGTATSWEVEVVPAASAPTGVGVPAPTNPFIATGLTPGTAYKYYVRANCGSGNFSQWVGPFNFLTTPAGSVCNAPITVATLPYSDTSNTNLYGDEVDVAQGASCGAGATNYQQGAEVFYSYTPTVSGNITISMTPTGVSSSLFVYNGCGNYPLNCIAGVANTNANPRVVTTLAVVAGQTYIIVISSSTTPAAGIPYTLIIQNVNCTAPAALAAANITTTSADLSWSNPSGATSWQVAVQPAGSPIPAGAGTTAGTNVNYPATGLTAATAYQYWVRADCGGGLFSAWSGPFLFNTATCDAADKCNYTFRMTDSFGDGWNGARMEVRQNGVVVATIGSTFTAGAGPINIVVPLCQTLPFELHWTVPGSFPAEVGVSVINNFAQTLFTKPAGTGAAPSLLYTGTFSCTTPACLPPTALTATVITTTGATLGWTANGGTAWNVYVVPTGSPAPTGATVPTYANITTNPLVITGLSPFTTYQYYVSTYCSSTSASTWAGPFSFTTLPTCLIPTTVTTTAITATTVTVGWTNTGTATSWNCLALPCGSPAPTAATAGWVVAPTNPFVMTGLNPGTCYDFYVRGVCSPTDSSPWSAPKSATTFPGCGGGFFDTGGAAANYGNNENSVITICPTNPGDIVTVTFTAFDTEANWDGLYVFDGNSVAAPQIPSTNPAGNVPGGLAGSYWGTAIPGPFVASSASGCLTFRFRSDAGGVRAGWTANVTCGPPPPCAKPQTLTVTNITPTSALLGWTQPLNPNGSQATAWQVLVLPCGSPAPTAATTGWSTTATNSFTAAGLNPATCYNFYVRAACSPTEVSLWAGPKAFTTLLINDECTGSIQAPVNQNTNCLQTVFGTVAGATASPQANSCGATASTADNDDVWFHFVATATTHHVSLLGVNYATNPTGLNFALYTGSCGTMTQFGGCITATESNNINGLTIGQTYYVRVYSTATTASTLQFELCIGTTMITCPTALPLCAIVPIVLPNNVGVPTLPNPVAPYSTTSSTVGCLGSAPAPTFYYLTIPTNGNYNFFLEQNSNSTFTGTGLDVDFAAWGPYASNAVACATISTANASATGGFCSFSAAFTENFTVNGAVAGQVYVLMITNYSQDKGFIRITQTTGPIPPICCPYTNFSYPGTFFCQGSSTIMPTPQNGGTLGTFSVTPAGLLINPVTGQIDLSSPVGSYTVTNTILGAGGCTTSATSWNITISAPVTAAITYAATDYCTSNTTPQTVTQTGTAGGSYYAIPAGLTINSTTGTITPSTSLAGVYTVNYAIASAGGCGTFLATTQVTITKLPVATFNYGTMPYCQNASNATPVFTGGGVAGTFSSTAGLVIDPVTGVVTVATSAIGTYTVTNTIPASGACGVVTATNTITISAPTVGTFNYGTALYCQNSSNASPIFTGGGVAGTFSSTTGLVVDPATGVVNIAASTAGTYTVTNTIAAANGCLAVTETAVIIINPNPTATIASSDADNTICSNDTATITVTPTNFTVGSATYTWTLNGNPIAGTTNVITPTATGTYAATVTLNGCTNVLPLSLLFTVNTLPDFTISGTNLVKCVDETAVLSVTPTNFGLTDAGITYSWTFNGAPVTPANTTSTLTVLGGALGYGTYAVTVDNFGCTTTHQVNVTLNTADIPISANGECVGANYIITALPIAGSFNPNPPAVTYEWTNSSGTVVGSNQNTFNVSQYIAANGSLAASFPQTFTVKITTSPEGCTDTQSFEVVSPICAIPKGISPNGDGDNDTFDLRGLGVKQLGIFNRYGTKVYSLANYTNEWKGQSDKGQELPDGTYYYVIDQNNGETKTGWVYINK
jgi:gliding motility-associated-like protein